MYSDKQHVTSHLSGLIQLTNLFPIVLNCASLPEDFVKTVYSVNRALGDAKTNFA